MAQKGKRRRRSVEPTKEVREIESWNDCYILFHSVIGVILSLAVDFIVIGFGQLSTPIHHVLWDDFCNDEQFRRNHTSTHSHSPARTQTSSNCFVHIAHIYTAMTKETKIKLWWMRGDQWQRMEKLRDQNDIRGPRAAPNEWSTFSLILLLFVLEIDASEAEWTRECEHNMHTRRRKKKTPRTSAHTHTHTQTQPARERENRTFLIWFSLDVAISAHKKIRRDNKND